MINPTGRFHASVLSARDERRPPYTTADGRAVARVYGHRRSARGELLLHVSRLEVELGPDRVVRVDAVRDAQERAARRGDIALELEVRVVVQIEACAERRLAAVRLILGRERDGVACRGELVRGRDLLDHVRVRRVDLWKPRRRQPAFHSNM